MRDAALTMIIILGLLAFIVGTVYFMRQSRECKARGGVLVQVVGIGFKCVQELKE